MKSELSKQAIKFLKRLPQKHELQVVRRIANLTENPLAPDVKKVSGSDYFRVDSGEYRIVYEVRSEVLFVWLVGKRNDDEVYRRLRRMLR